MKTNYMMKKKKFHLFYQVLWFILSVKIYFPFSFCSDFNLEATVAKIDEIRDLKHLFTPCFLLIGKKSKIMINNYHIAHQKNHVKNNNDLTFN